MLDADTDKSEEERSTIFFKFVKDRQPITSAQYKAILAEASRLEIKDKASMILCELILNNDAIKLIRAHAPLFLMFTRDNKRAQKYLLGGACILLNWRTTDILTNLYWMSRKKNIREFNRRSSTLASH